jgi:hypothetical protein
MSLLARRLPIGFQHAVDMFFDRSQFRLFPNRFLSIRRYRTADRLTDHAPVNAVLLRQSLYRLSGCMSQPDLLE